MSLSDEVRQAALRLDEEAAAARRAVDGLVDRAGPHVWAGAVARSIVEGVETAVGHALRAAATLEEGAAEARRRAGELDRAEALRSIPLPD